MGKEFVILDVGCGNHSPSITKYWYPECEYHGIDITPEYSNDEQDRRMMDRFYLMDLNDSDLSELEDNYYDAIVFAQVIEHLKDGAGKLAVLIRKLKPGGYIYVDFPSRRSMSLPHAKNTLNFFDDPTHVRFVDIVEVVNTLIANDVRVISAGTLREWKRVSIGIFSLPFQLVTYLMSGQMDGRAMAHLLGFTSYVYGVRKE